MAGISPTQNSLKYLRKQGYTVAVTEHWNPFAHKRQDLFNFIDLLAIKEGCMLGVQTTSKANMAARRKKIAQEPLAQLWVRAHGIVEIHGWYKLGNRWQVKIESYPSKA